MRTIESDLPRLEGADVPVPARLGAARAAAKSCSRCPLYLRGPLTVFGEGPARAQAMFVGGLGELPRLPAHPGPSARWARFA